jgi:hypothetical protein
MSCRHSFSQKKEVPAQAQKGVARHETMTPQNNLPKTPKETCVFSFSYAFLMLWLALHKSFFLTQVEHFAVGSCPLNADSVGVDFTPPPLPKKKKKSVLQH